MKPIAKPPSTIYEVANDVSHVFSGPMRFIDNQDGTITGTKTGLLGPFPTADPTAEELAGVYQVAQDGSHVSSGLIGSYPTAEELAEVVGDTLINFDEDEPLEQWDSILGRLADVGYAIVRVSK